MTRTIPHTDPIGQAIALLAEAIADEVWEREVKAAMSTVAPIEIHDDDSETV